MTTSASSIIAFPSVAPGGLDSEISPHFGHCDVFTLVSLKDKKIESVSAVENLPHEQGGCMGPVNLLAGHGVKALIAGGMGMRPLLGFTEVGITVFHSGVATRTVAQAVEAFANDKLTPFDVDLTCGGHDHG